MQKRRLSIHDQVLIAEFELFLREAGAAPPVKPEERVAWEKDLLRRVETLSPNTRYILGFKEKYAKI